jgi:hypothetical protein
MSMVMVAAVALPASHQPCLAFEQVAQGALWLPCAVRSVPLKARSRSVRIDIDLRDAYKVGHEVGSASLS